MRKHTSLIFAALVAFGASGSTAFADACSGRSHDTGSILGAVGGGLIGSAITHGSAVGVVGGAVAGGFAGNAIARDIDCNRGRHYDRQAHGYYYYDHHGRRIYQERVVRRDRDGHRVYEDRYVRRDDHDGDRYRHD